MLATISPVLWVRQEGLSERARSRRENQALTKERGKQVLFQKSYWTTDLDLCSEREKPTAAVPMSDVSSERLISGEAEQMKDIEKRSLKLLK